MEGTLRENGVLPTILTNFVGFKHSNLQTSEIFIVAILKPLTTNGFTTNVSFNFPEEIVGQQPDIISSSCRYNSFSQNSRH